MIVRGRCTHRNRQNGKKFFTFNCGDIPGLHWYFTFNWEPQTLHYSFGIFLPISDIWYCSSPFPHFPFLHSALSIILAFLLGAPEFDIHCNSHVTRKRILIYKSGLMSLSGPWLNLNKCDLLPFNYSVCLYSYEWV